MFDDRDYLSHQLEAMKMAQATLQQIMTLSAGGLAIFFSFIGKAPFIVAFDVLGFGVVFSWIVSLSAAAYAHRVHSTLFMNIARLHAVSKKAAVLNTLPEEVEAELRINPNGKAVIERARKRLADERERVLNVAAEFEATFFPAQDRVHRAVRLSLAMLVVGFAELGIAYGLSRYAT